MQAGSVYAFIEKAPLASQVNLLYEVFPPELEVLAKHAPKSNGLKLAFAMIVPLQLGIENCDVV